MSPRVVDRAAKRQMILAAAIAEFGQRGYHSTTMANIAQRAKMGKGTLYEYFRTKEEIPQAIFSTFFSGIDEQLNCLQQQPDPPLEILIQGVKLCFVGLEDYAEITPLTFELLGNRELDRTLGLSQQFQVWLNTLSTFFTQQIEAGQRDGSITQTIAGSAFARMLVGMVDGMGLHYCMFCFEPDMLAAQLHELEAMLRSHLPA